MRHPRYERLVMLGTALQTRGGIAAVLQIYRAEGLFERWPIDYLPTHCDGGTLRKLLTAASQLARFILLLARHGRVLVHVHSASHASFWRKSVFMAVGMLAKCPVIFHLHGGGFARFYETECGAARRRLIRFFLDRSACVIVLSERWRNWIQGVSGNPRVVCIPNPVAAGQGRSWARRGKTVLFLGRLERAKGILDLLDAVGALRLAIPGIRLVCAGSGDLDAVAQYAKRLGIEDAVELPGWVGTSEKRALMRAAAVFVLPSHAEGLPMSLLEAMASGLPVVATRVGGIPDVVADGCNGFLFAPGDTVALEGLLRKLLLDPQVGQRAAGAALETIRLQCTAERVVAQLERVYAELGLSASGRRSDLAAAAAGGRMT